MIAGFLKAILLGGILFMFSVTMFAHHGTFVSYDAEHPITMTAIVTEFHYTNPHIQLYFDAKDHEGKVTHWAAEGPDPAVLVQSGWGRKHTVAALAPGTEIKVTIAPSRNGKPVGILTNVIFADGDSLCGLSDSRGKGNCPQQ